MDAPAAPTFVRAPVLPQALEHASPAQLAMLNHLLTQPSLLPFTNLEAFGFLPTAPTWLPPTSSHASVLNAGTTMIVAVRRFDEASDAVLPNGEPRQVVVIQHGLAVLHVAPAHPTCSVRSVALGAVPVPVPAASRARLSPEVRAAIKAYWPMAANVLQTALAAMVDKL
jgi:hypothetical protein